MTETNIFIPPSFSFCLFTNRNHELKRIAYIVTVAQETILSFLVLTVFRTQAKGKLEIFYNLILILFPLTLWSSTKDLDNIFCSFQNTCMIQSTFLLPVMNVGNIILFSCCVWISLL